MLPFIWMGLVAADINVSSQYLSEKNARMTTQNESFTSESPPHRLKIQARRAAVWQ
jgi:hypothetical protein